ncbi:MAG: UDP-N-acetylmuramoyl-L-alanyl-D-glutamate--2,6-diaminopimelate ligase [bacterium]
MPEISSASATVRPRELRPVPLTRLAELLHLHLARIGSDADSDVDRRPGRQGDVDGAPAVTGVSAASSDVEPGDLFAALPGGRVHGARFAAAARDRGAVALLTDPAGAALARADDVDLPTLAVAYPRAVLGEVSAEVFGRPSRRLAVVGITGTSGKTTTTFLVRAGLAAVGRPAGIIGTVGAFAGDEPLVAGLTTPEAPRTQALLAVMAERGMAAAVMEVSSHALALHRADGIEFAVGAFTNLSQDHLDFHRDMDDYFEAKARLFDGRARRAVVVVDDERGRALAARLGADAVTVSTRSARGAATWTADAIRTAAEGTTSFTAHGPHGPVDAGCAIPGRYNVANVLLALAVLSELGVDLATAGHAVAQAQVPGRMERVDAGQGLLAVVDYSHKPAAVTGALRALRPLTSGRLTIVLGCGGDRDREKRPLMGAAAARGADRLIVTDDNPRSEDPASIRAAMLTGARSVPTGERGEILEVGDRAEAIATAVAGARAGDTVLVAGKGHETGQEIAGRVLAFDDRRVLADALRAGRVPA